MDINHKRNALLSVLGTMVVLSMIQLAGSYGSEYQIRILNNIAIFIVMAVSYNLINGVTGQFSLAPNRRRPVTELKTWMAFL